MKICFVAPNIYPVISNKKNVEIIGGSELQQSFIGKKLQENGCQVRYITEDYGQIDGEDIDGLIIFKSYKPNEGVFGLRFFYPRLYKTWRALKKTDADIYFVRAETYLLGIVAFFCKIFRKKFIFSGAHDSNFIPDQFKMTTKYKTITLRDKLLYQYGLRRADFIIVQSKFQKRKFWDNYGLKGEIVRNFHPSDPIILSPSQRKFILWVATIRSWKRPTQFLSLAKAFPNETFIMIGGRDFKDKYLYDEIKEQAEPIKNLRFLGFQPFTKTETYFDKCKVFVNTSKYEGFPNTFLQAWRRGVPVISYVDPDGVIETNRLGRVVHSENDLIHVLSEMLSNRFWDAKHICDYFSRYHSITTMDRYCSIFEALIQTG